MADVCLYIYLYTLNWTYKDPQVNFIFLKKTSIEKRNEIWKKNNQTNKNKTTDIVAVLSPWTFCTVAQGQQLLLVSNKER